MATEETLVIVGGGPAALAAARGYRDVGGEGAVRMLSADAEAPYFRPPLSKEFLRGESEDADLPLEASGFYRDNGIELSLDTEVAELDTEAKTVRAANGEVVPYTACVLATGARPNRPPLPGTDHPDVLQLRSAATGRTLRERAKGARDAIVVGSGFIGCEAAVSLARRGLRVTVLSPDPAPQRPRLGEAVGRRIRQWLESEGVSFLAETRLEGVEDGHRLKTDPKYDLDTDLLLLATGIRPNAELAERAGITLEQRRIPADEHLRANAQDVYAVGDVVLAHNTAADRRVPVEHWGDAETMGEIAGRNAAGRPAEWAQAPGFWSVIGDRVLKYSAWGDGFDEVRVISHDNGGFTAWYGLRGTVVGVLAHEADDDYERGGELVERGKPIWAVS